MYKMNYSNYCAPYQEGAQQSVVDTTVTTVKKSTKVKNPTDAILELYRNRFDKQDLKSVESKRASLEYALQKAAPKYFTPKYTRDTFMLNFAKRVYALTQYLPFRNYMRSKGFDAYNAATHIALLSKQTLIEIFLGGDEMNLETFDEFNKPVITKDEFKNILNKNIDEEINA